MEVRVPWHRKLVYRARNVHEPVAMELLERIRQNARRWRELDAAVKKETGGRVPVGTQFSELVKRLPPEKREGVVELIGSTIRTNLTTMSQVPEGQWESDKAARSILVLDTLVRSLGELKGRKALMEVYAEAKGEHNVFEAKGIKLPGRQRAYEAFENLMRGID